MDIRCGFCVPIFAAPGQWWFRTPNYDALDANKTMAMACEADALGYDACGMEEDKRFISVPAEAVRGPKSMNKEEKARYMKMAKNKDTQVENLLELVQETSLVGFIEHMQDYQSRNSYSGDNGLDQAADWAEGIFSTFGFAVTRHTFRDDMTAQVVSTATV